MKKVILVSGLILMSSLLIGCGQKEVKKEDGVSLTMVFVPASEKAQSNEFESLLKIVEKITGYAIKNIDVSDYNAAVEAMRAGRADMAWFGAKTYIKAAEIANAEAFAAGVKKGDKDAGYQVHFIVPKGSPITQFTKAQLQGKGLALNHIGSTSGDLVPRFELSKIGMDTTNKEHFKFVQYAGSHDAAIMTVVNQHADFAGVSSRNYDARVKDGTLDANAVTIIHSAYVTPPPLAYRKDLPEEVKKNIKKAVLEAHKHGTIGGYGGEMEKYISVEDKDFEELREMNRIMESK
ncbi:MAG: phosphate/phosphite/phosphonate ABC transporter substrate-binding protein [Candidatus Omnitrophica bacterium]|nr:phosphate/phosphite/phosphonate ABC transporter substrate-binding protein [Candidatus Omnitrophota bacterium]